MKRALLIAVLLLGACCAKKDDTTPEQPDGLPCGLTAARSLAPLPNAPAMLTLDQHRAAGTAQGLNPDDLKSHCQQLWQDVIEAQHCSSAVADFCQTACTTDQARDACTSGRPHDRAVIQCLEQTKPVFQERYPPCVGFTPPQ
jgi:hypothetical protein